MYKIVSSPDPAQPTLATVKLAFIDVIPQPAFIAKVISKFQAARGTRTAFSRDGLSKVASRANNLAHATPHKHVCLIHVSLLLVALFVVADPAPKYAPTTRCDELAATAVVLAT